MLRAILFHMQILFTIKGIVRRGKSRGKLLGFPTANISIDTHIPEGIYLSVTHFQNKKFPALTFIGIAQTFHETLYQAETYILDFDQDLYEQEITVDLLEKIRDSEKFSSQKTLITQMEKDKRIAQEFFTKHPSYLV